MNAHAIERSIRAASQSLAQEGWPSPSRTFDLEVSRDAAAAMGRFLDPLRRESLAENTIRFRFATYRITITDDDSSDIAVLRPIEHPEASVVFRLGAT